MLSVLIICRFQPFPCLTKTVNWITLQKFPFTLLWWGELCIKLIHGKTLPSKMSRSFTADYCSRAIITVVSVRPEFSRQTQTRLPLQIQTCVQLAYRCKNFEKLHSLLIGYLGLSSVVVLLWTYGIENIKWGPKTSTFWGKTKEVINGMFMQTPKETYLF